LYHNRNDTLAAIFQLRFGEKASMSKMITDFLGWTQGKGGEMEAKTMCATAVAMTILVFSMLSVTVNAGQNGAQADKPDDSGFEAPPVGRRSKTSYWA
jgi:hypothetical protein